MIAPRLAKSKSPGEFSAPWTCLAYGPAGCYNPWMLYLRILSAAYWAFLTVLLLVPNPAALFFNLRPVSSVAGMRGVHFTAFTLLALLVQTARFPVRPRFQWAVLLGYALAVESLQWFVPLRSVELADYTENLLGLAVGALVFWAVSAWLGRGQSRSGEQG